MYIDFAPPKKNQASPRKTGVEVQCFCPMNTTAFFRHYQGYSVTPFIPKQNHLLVGPFFPIKIIEFPSSHSIFKGSNDQTSLKDQNLSTPKMWGYKNWMIEPIPPKDMALQSKPPTNKNIWKFHPLKHPVFFGRGLGKTFHTQWPSKIPQPFQEKKIQPPNSALLPGFFIISKAKEAKLSTFS